MSTGLGWKLYVNHPCSALRKMPPQLIADVTLYPTAEGGKKLVAQLGWGCPCMVSKSPRLLGYDGCPLLDEPMEPGEQRRRGLGVRKAHLLKLRGIGLQTLGGTS